MSMEILSERQLLEQKSRRESLLKKLRADNAPPAAIAEAENKLRLTQLRLERIRKMKD